MWRNGRRLNFGWGRDVDGGGPTAFHGLNTGFCREKRLLVYILCCTHELTLLAASAFAAFEGCLLSLQQIEEGKVLKIRYTLGNRYLVDICCLSEAFLGGQNLKQMAPQQQELA